MSTFSTNNRFSVLMKKTNEKEIIKTQENKFNSFKNDKPIIQKNNLLEKNYRNEFRRHQEYENRRLNIEDKIKKAKENEIKILTNVENFPELKTCTKKEQTTIDYCEDNKKYYSKLLNINSDLSLINAVHNEKIRGSHNDDDDDENVPEGCVCIKFDKKENKIKWVYGKGLNTITIEDINDNYENPYIVMSKLVKLNKIRRNEHIRKWGIDEYEYMFMFPNYDYKYYDRVDEVYDYDYDCHFEHNNPSSYYYEDYEY